MGGLEKEEIEDIARSVARYQPTEPITPQADPFDLIASSGLRAVPEGSPAGAYAEPLRRLASYLQQADELTRAVMRDEAIRLLKERGLHSPAKIVDAALAGRPAESD